MVKPRFLLLLKLLAWGSAPAACYGQNTSNNPGLTLIACYTLAEQHAPLTRQVALNEAQLANTHRRLLQQHRLPQLALNGQASYQSEVTSIPLEVPGVEAVAKDQYRVTLDASQTVWDGAVTHRQLELETAATQVSNQQAGVGLYRVREQINRLFFGVLVGDATVRLRQAFRSDLLTRRKMLEARRTNGTATGQDMARLDAELLNLDQQLQELAISRRAQLRQLGELIGQPLESEATLQPPAALPPAVARPEYQLYAAQRAQLAQQQLLNDARLRPRLSLYAQAGYGRPGLDLLRNDFHGYGQGGVRLTWTLSNYFTRRQDRTAIRLGAEVVAVQEAQFEQQQQVEAAGLAANVARLESQLATDRQLIPLREKIQTTAAAQLEHGIIGFSEYFTEANNLTQARLNEQLHGLQLLQAQLELQTAQGAPSAARP